jgi:hypothetical protein
MTNLLHLILLGFMMRDVDMGGCFSSPNGHDKSTLLLALAYFTS